MKKLLATCDQVFEVLTRGPFPTGDSSDESVEHHLRACHECRQLAEALRPAVALLHEAVAADQAMGLPGYQGSLPQDEAQPRHLSVVRLASSPRPTSPAPLSSRAPARREEADHRSTSNYVRLIAATLIVAGLTTWLWGLAADTNKGRPSAFLPAFLTERPLAAAAPADGLPTDVGLLTLASLRLPAACLPVTHRPLSQEHSAELALAIVHGSLDKLLCCTECHHAGQANPEIPHSADLIAISQRNCQACHRG